MAENPSREQSLRRQQMNMPDQLRSLSPIISRSSRKPSPIAVPRQGRPSQIQSQQQPRYALQQSTTSIQPRPSIRTRDFGASPSVENMSTSPSPVHTQQRAPQQPARSVAFVDLRSSDDSYVRDSVSFFERSPIDSEVSPALGRAQSPYDESVAGDGVQTFYYGTQRTNSGREGNPVRESETLPLVHHSDRLRALSEAMASGELVSRPTTPLEILPATVYNGTRMPFNDSPVSVRSDDESRLAWDSSESGTEYNPEAYRPTQISNHEQTSALRLPPVQERSTSALSNNPLLSSQSFRPPPSIASRIPSNRRPPRLDMSAVRETGSRSSITSLPDLIRRATKLASNLDRGKTASKLGLDAILGSERNGHRRGESTYTDVLFSFPAPVSGSSSTRRNGTPVTIWPQDEKTNPRPVRKPVQRGRQASNVPRRCCGMSLKLFLIIMIVLAILVAAAILIPIFLVLIPRQNATSSAGTQDCAALFPCGNGGISVMDENVCACVCVNGFTGSQCSIAADPSCTILDLTEGSSVYPNATLGTDMPPIPVMAQTQFDIRLNNTILLSLFSRNNFSCSAENSLVQFSLRTSKFLRRHDRTAESSTVSSIESSLQESSPTAVSSVRRTSRPVPRRTSRTVSDDQEWRSSAHTKPSVTPRATSTTRTAPVSRTSSEMEPSLSSSVPVPSDRQVDFARIAVLFVLQQTRSPSIAVTAQQILQRYLWIGGPSQPNATVDVVPDDGESNKITVNFTDFTLEVANGPTIGGRPP